MKGKEVDLYGVWWKVTKTEAPISDELTLQIRQTLIPQFEELMKKRTSDPTLVSTLARIRDKSADVLNSPLSRPGLVALYGSSWLAGNFFTGSKTMLALSKNDWFRIYYELGFGAQMMFTSVFSAEDAVRGELDQSIAEVLSQEQEKDHLPTSTLTEIYLAETKQVEKYADPRKLLDDPTGFKLFEANVEQIKRDAETGEPGITEFTVQGAILAQRFYHLIYPLTENLPMSAFRH